MYALTKRTTPMVGLFIAMLLAVAMAPRFMVAAHLPAVVSAGPVPACANADPSPRKLNPTGYVMSMALTPDGQHVVYTAGPGPDSMFELYSIPIAGGTPVKLNGPLVTDTSVLDFQISPDSERVLYRPGQGFSGFDNLYSVPLAGGSSVKLNEPLDISEYVSSYFISSDSSRAIFTVARGSGHTDSQDIYSVPIAGGTPVRLNPALAANQRAETAFVISPDNSRLIYELHQSSGITSEMSLYSAPLAGGASVLLDGPFSTQYFVGRPAQLSPDGAFVIYNGRHAGQNSTKLYRVPLTGGTPLELYTTPAAIYTDLFFRISPDGSRVVFSSDGQLYSVALATGGASTPLGSAASFAISPDSSRVVFSVHNNISQLFSIPIAGGNPVKLNGALHQSSGGVLAFVISPDSSRVVYMADQEIDDIGLNQVYSAPIGGGAAAVKISISSLSDISTRDITFTPDSQHVLYRAREGVFYDLFVSPTAVGGMARKLNGSMSLVEGSPIITYKGFLVTPDGLQTVFIGGRNPECEDNRDLFVVDILLGRKTYLPLVLR